MTLYLRTLGFPPDGWLPFADRMLARIARAKEAWPEFKIGLDIVAPYKQNERVKGSGQFAYELDQRSQLAAENPTHPALDNYEFRAALTKLRNRHPVHEFTGEFHKCWRRSTEPQADWLNRILHRELSGALVPGVTIGLGQPIGGAAATGRIDREDDLRALCEAIADRGCRVTGEARIEQNIDWHKGLRVGLYASEPQFKDALAGRVDKGQTWERPENIAGEKIVVLDLKPLPKPNKADYAEKAAFNLARIQEYTRQEFSVAVNSPDAPGYGEG